MKRVLGIFLALVLILATMAGCSGGTKEPETTQGSTKAPVQANPVVRCSTTTSVNDSGLLPYLEPMFEAATGYDLQVTSKGTGAAIKLGETGDADLLLVHAKASEEEFVEKGFGIERKPFMYNFFVIVGPANDPAGIKGSATAAEALAKIAAAKAPFISRGDDSGTHKKELALWKDAGLSPDKAKGDEWYTSAGKGMGECLTMGSETDAYVITDKGTYLSMKDKLELEILLGESDDMKNTYSLIACNPEKNPGLNSEGANAFIEWMLKEETLNLIAQYGIDKYGEALFLIIK